MHSNFLEFAVKNRDSSQTCSDYSQKCITCPLKYLLTTGSSKSKLKPAIIMLGHIFCTS